MDVGQLPVQSSPHLICSFCISILICKDPMGEGNGYSLLDMFLIIVLSDEEEENKKRKRK